ncbi:PDZ domain-containing protein [Oscillospiraceae bacterium OttesenSCG-928-F05]|nr:PDZ domain-containing protein [Oscillospiraceae bacterium OttesenSCG-928-F05]
MKKRFNLMVVTGILLLAAVLAFTLTYQIVFTSFNQQLAITHEGHPVRDKCAKVLEYLEKDYVGPAEFDALITGALKGMVAATGDLSTEYLDAAAYGAVRRAQAEDFTGIGVSLSAARAEEGLLVTRVHPESGAAAAGLEPRSLIVAVDGESIADKGHDALEEALGGPAGTLVTLDVLPDGGHDVKTVQVLRTPYTYQPVLSEIIDGDIGYVRIEAFDASTPAAFTDTCRLLTDAGAEALIIDVRGTTEGETEPLVQTLGALLGPGPVLSLTDHGGEEKTFSAESGGQITLPTVVLIDDGTAGEAEYFAAVLKEAGRAEIVGTSSAGKAYLQTMIPLSDGSALRVSTHIYKTPSGASVEKTGVLPDHTVALTERDRANLAFLPHDEDEQLMKAYQLTRDALDAVFLPVLPGNSPAPPSAS